MSTLRGAHVNIVGAGLAGALLALLLARRGLKVTLYERRPDPRQSRPERGRSINLALAARGIRALEEAGLMAEVRPLLIAMHGRMVHELSGPATLQPYGQRADEVIWSVGRADLNRVLIAGALAHEGVRVHFDQQLIDASLAADRLRLRDARGTVREVPLGVTIGTDGAGSALRAALAGEQLTRVREDWLDHDYKELTVPPAAGGPALARHALHIWPRGGFMLIALPNTDASFTATLFLARTGTPSFAELTTPEAVARFFAREFADAVAHMPQLLAEFFSHPQGQLGTVHATPWRAGGRALLLGDAAHAIVPFHGQGMNAAFEDCTLLDALVNGAGGFEELFARYEAARRRDTEAIAQMALENYGEMRDAVRDKVFVRRKALAMALERHFPGRFIPRYSMVMFHPEIPYAQALERGAIQARLLEELDPGEAGEADLPRAARLIEARLPPLDGQ